MPTNLITLGKAQNNIRLQKVITVVAMFLFLVKITAWYLTNSVAILTDALESIVNILAAFLGLFSLNLSAKPKDVDHPYGHGKVEFISSAVEGTLIMVAGFLVIYEACINFIHPHLIQKLDRGIVLVGATAVVNYIMGAVCLHTGKRNNSVPLISSGKHLQTDTWSTAGIIAGLILLYYTKLAWIDSAVAIIFACLIMYTGYRIIRTSIAGIMDEADLELLNKLVQMLNNRRNENWVDLHNLRIIKYGGTLHMDCHLTVPWYLNVREAHDEIERLGTLVKSEYPESVELFVHSDGCMEYSCRICFKHDCLVRMHEFEKKIEWTIANISLDRKHRLAKAENEESE